MKHLGSKTLETERLILRKLNLTDANDMFKNWASDPIVTKYLTWPAHSNVEVTKSIIQMWADESLNDNFYQWGIELKSIKKPVGTIGSVNVSDDLGCIELGYCIGKSFWNKGIVSEALQRVIQFFFEEVNADRIEAKHDVNNPNSGLVMKKCGMKYEGTKRQAAINNTGICDVSGYAILKCDYEELKKDILTR